MDICGKISYELGFRDDFESELNIEDLLAVSEGIFILKPSSIVRAGDYFLKIMATMDDHPEVQPASKPIDVIINSYYNDLPILDVPKR